MAANSPTTKVSKKDYRINKEITASKVRLVESKDDLVGEKDLSDMCSGVMSLDDALAQARRYGLDLVEMSPNADPPVVQLMNYGRFKFLKKKNTKKQKIFKIKEIKLRPVTDEGDYKVKLRNLLGFLASGDKVKVTIRFRGREISHHDLGDRLLDRVEKDVGPYGAIEQRTKLEGRQLIMVLAPTKVAAELKSGASKQLDGDEQSV